MNRFGPKATKTIAKTMREFKEGRLRSGRARKPVKNRKQAIAIGISKARKNRFKTPSKSS